jgi:hypothetical protein
VLGSGRGGRPCGSWDRVKERRRAARLARHYRDVEDRSIAEIACRLGRAQATVKAYLYDAIAEKAREVKQRYRGVYRGYGAATTARKQQGRRLRVAEKPRSCVDRTSPGRPCPI